MLLDFVLEKKKTLKIDKKGKNLCFHELTKKYNIL